LDYFAAAAAVSSKIDFAATNNSWSGGGYSQSLFDSIVRGAQNDILFIAAAGNSSSDNDITASYPGNYNTTVAVGFDAVISVAALTESGSLASFSSYGASHVELAAPGEGIYSTLAGGGYGYMSGTSMATPHVAGAIALISSISSANAAELRNQLLETTIATPSLSGKTSTGGRLDVSSFVLKALPITISAAFDDAGKLNGSVASGGSGDDNSPLLSGTLASSLSHSSIVAVYRDGVRVGEASVSGTKWSFQDELVGTGSHTYEARIEDEASIAQARSASFIYNVLPEKLFGTRSAETLQGTSAAEEISGVPSGGTYLGRGTVDTLIGNGGIDLFILGDGRGRFYDDGKAQSSGANDYALIRDFGSDDRVQLAGASHEYTFSRTSVNGVTGLGIYHDSNGNGLWDSKDELIGLLGGVNAADLSQFIFV
jgi:hypothetical protein